LRRGGGADEGEPLGADPRPHALAPARRCRPIHGLPEPAGPLSSTEAARRDRLGARLAPPRRRAPERARVPRPTQGRSPRLLAPLLLEARAAVAGRADGQCGPHRRELPRPGRGWPARRPDGPRLVGAPGPVPEPRPVP